MGSELRNKEATNQQKDTAFSGSGGSWKMEGGCVSRSSPDVPAG